MRVLSMSGILTIRGREMEAFALGSHWKVSIKVHNDSLMSGAGGSQEGQCVHEQDQEQQRSLRFLPMRRQWRNFRYCFLARYPRNSRIHINWEESKKA